jgi:hypothetical protein
MKRIALHVVLAIGCLFLSACGSDSGDPADDTGDSPEPAVVDSQKPATPEELGKAVANTLIRNELQGYLDLCLSVEDRIALTKASTFPEEKKQKMIDGLGREREAFDERFRGGFVRIAEQPIWTDAVVDTIMAEETKVEDGIGRCDSIRVTFKDGSELLIEGAHETPAGWGIDEGISYFPKTEPPPAELPE